MTQCPHGITPTWDCIDCWEPDPEFGIAGANGIDAARPKGAPADAGSIPAASTSSSEFRGFMTSSKDRQVGGDHYSKLKIQPGEYAMANGFNYFQSHALVYLTRYKSKGGAQDIDKAIHCLQLLKEYEYGPQTVQAKDNRA